MSEFLEVLRGLVPMLMIGASALAYVHAIDSLRLARRPRVWLPVLIGTMVIVGSGLFLASHEDAPNWQGALGLTIAVCGMGAIITGLLILITSAARIRSAVTKLMAIEDQGGVNSPNLRVGHRNPALHLRQLLPLIEPLGHAPGHPEITPEWIRERLAQLGEPVPVARLPK
jgi:hypothetical protein